MAEDKIVTKKTSVKPSTYAPKTPIGQKAGTKKTTVKAATPAPAPAETQPKTERKASPKAAAVQASSAGPAAPAKKTAAKKAEPGTGRAASPKAALEDKPVDLKGLAHVNNDQREAMIAEAAYFKAEKRNFVGGDTAQDWADAEREIDELLAKARQIYGD